MQLLEEEGAEEGEQVDAVRPQKRRGPPPGRGRTTNVLGKRAYYHSRSCMPILQGDQMGPDSDDEDDDQEWQVSHPKQLEPLQLPYPLLIARGGKWGRLRGGACCRGGASGDCRGTAA